MVRFGRRDLLLGTLAAFVGVGPTSATAGEAEVNAIIRSLAPIRGQRRSEGYPDTPPPPDYYGGTRTEPDIEGETIVVVPSRAIDLEVYFEFDSAALTGRTRADLRALGRALASRELEPFRYLIAGHTDGVGDPYYNLELSRRRAWAVKDHLIATFPIDPYRLRRRFASDAQWERQQWLRLRVAAESLARFSNRLQVSLREQSYARLLPEPDGAAPPWAVLDALRDNLTGQADPNPPVALPDDPDPAVDWYRPDTPAFFDELHALLEPAREGTANPAVLRDGAPRPFAELRQVPRD